MKKLFLLFTLLTACILTKAECTINFDSTTGVLTVTSSAGEQLEWGSFTTEQKTSTTKIQLIGTFSINDIGKFGFSDFKAVKVLDLSAARIDNYESYSSLGTQIGSNAPIEEILLPESSDYTKVPDGLLENMQSKTLKKLVIPGNYTEIGAKAFRNIGDLSVDGARVAITIPDGITKIGQGAFQLSPITSIRLPLGLTTIEAETFDGCQYLTSVIISENVTSIGDYAFKDCNRLRDIYCLGKTAPTLGTDVFSNLTTYCEGSIEEVTKHQEENPDYTEGGSEPQYIMNRTAYWQSGDMTNSTHIGCAVLHLRNDLTADELAGYADINKIKLDGGSYTYKSEYGGIRWPDREQLAACANETGWWRFGVVTYFTYPDNVIEFEKPDDDTWYTIVLPFPMTKDEVETTFGGGTELCKFVGMKKEGTGQSTRYTLDFTEVVFNADTDPVTTVLTADFPYMIRPTTAPKNSNGKVTFRFVNSKYSSVIGTESNLAEGVKGTKDGEEGYESGYIFKGTYIKQLIPYHYYFLGRVKTGEKPKAYYLETSNDQSRTSGYWKPNSCVVIPPDVDNVPSKKMLLGTDEESYAASATGIEAVDAGKTIVAERNADKVYNLNGQFVGRRSAISSLPKGIYIAGGKKFIVK